MSKNATQPSITLGVITVVLAVAGWSSIPLFLRHFTESVDMWTSNGWRYGFSALVWLPVIVFATMRRRLPRGLWRAAVVPSIVNAAGQVCFTWAHYRIDPGLLTFGLRTQLLFVAVGAYLLFPKERLVIRSPGYLVGAGLLIVGMIGVMALDGGTSPLTTGEGQGVSDSAAPVDAHGVIRGTDAAHVQGVLLAVGSGLLFALYGLSVRKYMEGVNAVIAFAAICQYTAIALVALMVIFGARAGLSALDLPGDEMWLLLLSALIGIAIGHVFYYISIARLGVAVTAGVLQLQPFIVAVGSYALFDEVLSGWQWAGGVVAVMGAMLMLSVQYRMSRRRKSIEEPVAIAEGESGS